MRYELLALRGGERWAVIGSYETLEDARKALVEYYMESEGAPVARIYDGYLGACVD